MTHRRILHAPLLPVAAFFGLSIAPAPLLADVATPDVGITELETRVERDARATREVDDLRKRSITKISQLAGGSRSSASAVVGTERAAALAGVLLSKASKAAQAGFIEPQFAVASSFLVGSDFIILHTPSPTRSR